MDEETCKTALFQIRWPQGFSCPRCGCARYYPIPGRDQYECAHCGRQFSCTSGTFMHKSRQPLRVWFEAVGLLYADSGISAAALGRKLGLTGPTACLMLKKIKLGLETGDRLLLGKMASLWGGVHLSPGKARTSSSEWL